MESVELLCHKAPGRYLGETRISFLDSKGTEIKGLVYTKEKEIRVDILEDQGDKAFVLLPPGMTKKTAWINSENLN